MQGNEVNADSISELQNVKSFIKLDSDRDKSLDILYR